MRQSTFSRTSTRERPTTALLTAMSCLFLLQTFPSAQAFVAPAVINIARSTPLTTASSFSNSRLYMDFSNWEEFVYHAESAASVFARKSLEDPNNVLASLPVMYGAGLLTSVSPCVWGLLPLTLSYISTAAGERSDKKAILPTLAFAGGLASVFCTLGIVAATVGGVFGSSNSENTFASLATALLSSGVCLAMGLQLLDLVQLPLLNVNFSLDSNTSSNGKVKVSSEPVLLDGKGNILSDSTQEKQKQQGSLVRTFLLGGSSALVASPCATPVLTSILAFVANSNDPVLGAVLLLGYTLGYSTPLLIVAATGGQALANLKAQGGSSLYANIAPWVSPVTGGVLLWYGTNGMLTALFGDPSLAGLAPILE